MHEMRPTAELCSLGLKDTVEDWYPTMDVREVNDEALEATEDGVGIEPIVSGTDMNECGWCECDSGGVNALPSRV